MIFSTAEAPPVNVYGKGIMLCMYVLYFVYICMHALDQFDVQYVTFMLDTIESSAADGSMEDIADGFLNLLLSFNQHFSGRQ